MTGAFAHQVFTAEEMKPLQKAAAKVAKQKADKEEKQKKEAAKKMAQLALLNAQLAELKREDEEREAERRAIKKAEEKKRREEDLVKLLQDKAVVIAKLAENTAAASFSDLEEEIPLPATTSMKYIFQNLSDVKVREITKAILKEKTLDGQILSYYANIREFLSLDSILRYKFAKIDTKYISPLRRLQKLIPTENEKRLAARDFLRARDKGVAILALNEIYLPHGIDKKQVRKNKLKNPFVDDQANEVRATGDSLNASLSGSEEVMNSSTREFFDDGEVEYPDALQFFIENEEGSAEIIQESNRMIEELKKMKALPEAKTEFIAKMRAKIAILLVSMSQYKKLRPVINDHKVAFDRRNISPRRLVIAWKALSHLSKRLKKKKLSEDVVKQILPILFQI